MASAGLRQERQLFAYLRVERLCAVVIEGDPEVRAFLGMNPTSKCADALGFRQPPDAPGARRVTIAESKGTQITTALEQLGNAAAGVFDKYGRETHVDLLLWVAGAHRRPEGYLSPGGGYRLEPLKSGRSKFALQQSMGGPPVPAQPLVTCPEWAQWFPLVARLPIVVVVPNLAL